MKVNSDIFKAYDVRGAYPREINEETAYKIGQAFVRFTKAKRILIGRDIRLSSKSLRDSLISGINSQGAGVLDIGLCSTPAFYFASAICPVDAALMVTASHAGKEFNGLKPVFAGNIPLTREKIEELKKNIIGKEYNVISSEKKINEKNFNQPYIDAIRSFIKNKLKPFKIVIDAGNGMAGLYVDKIFKGTGLEIVSVFTELDGNFPNRGSNPKIPANRQKLVKKILAEKADLGVMFDGDADRAYFLDRKGETVDPNLISALIAEYLIKQTGKKKVLIEVRTSRVVEDYVKRAGGKTELSVCWTIPIKLKMIAEPEIIFGSETSGHYVFADFYKIDDGILSALIFLQAISAKKEPIDEIIDDFKKKYFIIEETNFEINNRGQAEEILAVLEKNYEKQKGEIIKIDGLTVRFNNWWFNLRLSETEPFIRLNLEADSRGLMKEKKEELSSLLKSLTQEK